MATHRLCMQPDLQHNLCCTSLEKLPGGNSLLGFTVQLGMNIGRLPEATGLNVWRTKPCLLVDIFHSGCWVSCDALLAFINMYLAHQSCRNTKAAPGCSLPSYCATNAARQAHTSLLLSSSVLSLATLEMLWRFVNLRSSPFLAVMIASHVTINVMAVVLLVNPFVMSCCDADTQAQMSATLCNCLLRMRSYSILSRSWQIASKLTPWPPMLSQCTATTPHLTP